MFYVLFKAEFEIGKGLFENLENSKSDLPNFWKFENWKSFQMNEPDILFILLFYSSNTSISGDKDKVKRALGLTKVLDIRKLYCRGHNKILYQKKRSRGRDKLWFHKRTNSGSTWKRNQFNYLRQLFSKGSWHKQKWQSFYSYSCTVCHINEESHNFDVSVLW